MIDSPWKARVTRDLNQWMNQILCLQLYPLLENDSLNIWWCAQTEERHLPLTEIFFCFKFFIFDPRERNGYHLPESEEEEVVVKKPCVTHPSALKITAPKHSLADVSSPQTHRQSLNGSLTSNFSAQDPLTCQQQTYIPVSAPQPTCDRKS